MTTLPLKSFGVNGLLLIHGPPEISGAGLPMSNAWAPPGHGVQFIKTAAIQNGKNLSLRFHAMCAESHLRGWSINELDDVWANLDADPDLMCENAEYRKKFPVGGDIGEISLDY